jgi:shikimate kinase
MFTQTLPRISRETLLLWVENDLVDSHKGIGYYSVTFRVPLLPFCMRATQMKSIILIGPYGVGKSTVGQLLAASRSQPQYSLDQYVWSYYGEKGLTNEIAATIGEFDSPHWQAYHAHAVKRFLEDHGNELCVMDLGAGHALYDGQYLDEMQLILAPYVVILLIPSPDIELSIQDLNERNDIHISKRRQPHAKWNRFFLNHPSSYQLTKHVVYTKGKTPAQTHQEILALHVE